MVTSERDYVERVRAGDRRAVARLITLLECQDPHAMRVLAALYPATGRAFLIGVTGPPGAGKSSLVDLLISAIREAGRTVGVVAVDPSSPFSGGAILGDRIRMKSHASDPGVFIRSMSSRGQLGGLALATRAACEVLDAYGCEVILVETVGVGQSEVAIAQATDSTVLVLPPNLGDGIQAIKSGIMEVPDLFVINKGDLPGAPQAASEILAMLEMGKHEGWAPPVLTTRSLDELDRSGVRELWSKLQDHHTYLQASGGLAVKRNRQARDEVSAMVRDRLDQALQRALEHPQLAELLVAVRDRQVAPTEAVRTILTTLKLD